MANPIGMLNETAARSNRQFFHGKAYDADSGLSYFGARYYDPVVGRFMAIDPAGFDESNLHSFNRYAYGNNNPYSYTDPDGRAAALIPYVVAAVRAGAQRLLTFALTRGAQASVTGAEIAAGEALGGASLAGGAAAAGARAAGEVGEAVAKEITLSRSIHGEAATHAADAIKAGKPSVLTVERAGAGGNRQASIGALDKVPGKHLDEYPPAMFREGGAGASVRPISPRDNMSAGACIGNACRGLADGSRVRIKIGD